jgi:hypothetical protein
VLLLLLLLLLLWQTTKGQLHTWFAEHLQPSLC